MFHVFQKPTVFVFLKSGLFLLFKELQKLIFRNIFYCGIVDIVSRPGETERRFQRITMFPDLEVTAVVRGEPVVNDADLEAARYVGLDRVVKVIGNGSGIAGTDLDDISDEARNEIETADVILSKGQGNFETIHGCGLNIYYLFLCKCDWFVRKFNAKRFEGMFINEKRIPG